MFSRTSKLPLEIYNFSWKIKTSARNLKVPLEIRIFRWNFKSSAEVLNCQLKSWKFAEVSKDSAGSCNSSAGFSDSAQKFLIFRLRIEIFGGRSRSSARVSKCQPDRFIFCGTFGFSAECPDCSEEVLVFGEASYFFPLNLFDLMQNSSMSCWTFQFSTEVLNP